MPQRKLSDRFEVLADLEKPPKSLKLSATHQDEFEVPIFLPNLQSELEGNHYQRLQGYALFQKNHV